MKQKNKQHILSRYGGIIGISLILAAAIVVKLFFTTVVDAQKWNDRAKKEMERLTDVDPERGNILADNGNILACNLKVTDIILDCRHEAITRKKIKFKSLDSLADSLDRYFPMKEGLDKMSAEERKKNSWHTRLKKQFEQDKSTRNRAMFITKDASEEDFKRMLTWPWLKQFAKLKGFKCPLYVKTRDKRVYPFGKMAELSVGRVHINQKTKKQEGYSGLERDLDSLLYGIPGQERNMALTGGMRKWTVKKPIRGYDVHTTINIDIQDMLEEELKKVCIDSKALWATSIIMETRTGDIKAISNMEWIEEEGRYGEALNRAVLAYEPGSVMKPIALMIAFEDGLVKSVNDAVDCSPFQGTSDPHAPTVKNMKQVIEMSSNTGIARVIFRGYQQHPENYHKRLEKIGFFDRFHSGIYRERIPFVPELGPIDRQGNKVTMTARLMSLARQAYGYNTMVPPLYTLAFYNAIANDGELIYPRLVQGLIDEEGRDSVIAPVKKRICSKETAAKVRECIREVVLSKHGTGHMLDDDRVALAGKTGTAFPISHGAYDRGYRRLAFAGFFPYDNPKYTMMTLILIPAGNGGAASTSGTVMKNMALRLYSRGMLDNVSTYTDETSDSSPIFIPAPGAGISDLRKTLGVKRAKVFSTDTSVGGAMPDLTGYDPAQAVALLERRGINVRLKGAGHVAGQTIAPGTPVTRGATVTLTLKL